MKYFYFFFALTGLFLQTCQAQSSGGVERKVGGPCEGCEAVLEYGGQPLPSSDTIPGFATTHPKLKIRGTIFKKDGETPAAGVIVYAYHANRQGLYEAEEQAPGWGRRHGQHRAWVKTGADGQYTFYTFRPAAYPDGSEPKHVHLTVKEPGLSEYYIDSIVFEDDPSLTQAEKKKLKNRGGSGIATPMERNGLQEVVRDIILGLNIPDY